VKRRRVRVKRKQQREKLTGARESSSAEGRKTSEGLNTDLENENKACERS